jgi:hypothetical protein
VVDEEDLRQRAAGGDVQPHLATCITER